MWPKKEKTEEKRKIEFQNKRRKEKKQKTPIPLNPGTQDGEMGLLHDLVKRKRREEKEKKKGKNRKEEEGNWPSDCPQRPVILGGASGRFWLGQGHSVSE